MRNAIFAMLFCLFLCGPFALFCLSSLHVPIPQNLTAEPAQYLSGGSKDADLPSKLSFDCFRSRSLQDALEENVSRHIPAKATAIIINAAAQRTAIEASNAVFGFSCYPTHFGSERIAYPEENAVTYLPMSLNGSIIQSWKEFAHYVTETAKRHPEKRFVIYVVEGYTEPAFNPAYDLMSRPMKPEYCYTAMQEETSSTENVLVLTRSYSNSNDYFDDFFRTDHHWNINGALVAHAQIAEALGLEQFNTGTDRPISGYLYTGATARSGLDMLQERVFDCSEDFSSLTALYPDGETKSGSDHTSFWDYPALGKPYMFYDAYYNNMGACTIEGGIGEKSGLLISNSYGGALQRPLAMSYKRLSVNGQLHPNSTLDQTLEEQIEASNADDIIFVANPSNLWVNPGYFAS